MPHYQNSVIYKIKHNEDYDDLNIYVGSTANFTRRKSKHKYNCNNENSENYNVSVYKYIRNNGGWDEWVMIPIEQYPCNNKDELKIRERYHIDLLRPTLNRNIPTRTIKEWYQDNKEEIAKYHKEYNIDNKEKNAEHKKQYYEDNKEEFKKKHKQYREANKAIISEKAKEKIICDHCGSEITRNGLSQHQKTKKCLNFVKKD